MNKPFSDTPRQDFGTGSDVNKNRHSVSIDTKDVNEMPKTTSNDDELRQHVENIVIADDYVHGIQMKTLDLMLRLIKQYGIEQRLDEVEETKYAIMRGEYGHSEVSIIKGFDERIAELTALKNKENK